MRNTVGSRIDESEVPTGFIVQIWAEAITNPHVHGAVNEVCTSAFEFFREYAAL